MHKIPKSHSYTPGNCLNNNCLLIHIDLQTKSRYLTCGTATGLAPAAAAAALAWLW